MTANQKKAAITLINGGMIAPGFRLLDNKKNPVLRLTPRSFHLIKRLCKLDKKGLYIISIQAVRKLRKNHFVKQYYLKNRIACNTQNPQ